MSRRNLESCLRVLAPLAFAASFVQTVAKAEDVVQVTVTASRPVTTTVGQSPRGAAVEEVTLHRSVGYADLDLATAKGARTLKGRVKDAARSSCKELQIRDPVPAPGGKDCFSAAVDSAMAQVNAAIAAAKSKAPHH